MKLTQLFPSACAIAFTSALYIFVAQYFQVSAIWLPYISWASYFLVGGKPSVLPKMIAGFTGGMLAGYVTIVAVSPVSGFVGSSFALPFVVFCLTLFILLLELVKPIDMIPVYFFSYASFFAYFFGGFGGGDATPLSVLPLFWVLLMVGFGLGFLTAQLRKKILHMQGIQK